MIFFDLDETLLDFKGAEYGAVKAIYDTYGDSFPLSSDDFYREWCTIGKKHFDRYLKGELSFQQQKIERMKEIYRLAELSISDGEARAYFQIYSSSFEDSWKAFDDVIPCLQQLTQHRLGILTNGDPQQQKLKLARIGILDYFEILVTAGEVGIAKPDIQLFEIACERARAKPADCFYIGDDLITDVLPCEKINMKGIWLNRRNVSAEGHVVTAIHSLSELKRLLVTLDV